MLELTRWSQELSSADFAPQAPTKMKKVKLTANFAPQVSRSTTLAPKVQVNASRAFPETSLTRTACRLVNLALAATTRLLGTSQNASRVLPAATLIRPVLQTALLANLAVSRRSKLPNPVLFVNSALVQHSPTTMVLQLAKCVLPALIRLLVRENVTQQQ